MTDDDRILAAQRLIAGASPALAHVLAPVLLEVFDLLVDQAVEEARNERKGIANQRRQKRPIRR